MKNTFYILILSLTLASCGSHEKGNGLIVKQSPYDVETTYTKLRGLVDGNPNLSIMLELDHAGNAASVGLELNPTRVILFGNPKLGTPLMQASPSVGIDLPQKILVYATDGAGCSIAYNDPMYLKERHSIAGKDEVLNKISKALDGITSKAIGEGVK